MSELLVKSLSELHPYELWFVLDKQLKGMGHYVGSPDNKLFLPCEGLACKLVLTFKKNQITSIERGPAFDESEWGMIMRVVEDGLIAGSTAFGREISFSSEPVNGCWSGERSQTQILPAPEDAPKAPDFGEHPFILEFPIKQSNIWEITNSRRRRTHQRLTLLLNLLLAHRISLQPRRPQHFWAAISHSVDEFDIRYVQQFYWANIGEIVREKPSSLPSERIPEVLPSEYANILGRDGMGMRVPSDLDEWICRYSELSKQRQEMFDRALFWLDMASLQWNLSFSVSFAALVSAIETFTGQGLHAKRRFIEFLETYAPGGSLEAMRKQMYVLRSDILHGSKLMQYDEDTFFSWSPHWLDEYELQSTLWRLTRIAIRNWLNPEHVL